MKQLNLTTPSYQYMEKSFGEWLDILGYAETTVKSLPIHVRELLHYLEQENIISIKAVQAKHINNFIGHLKTRPNLAYGGGLSTSYINKSILAVNIFARYLSATGKHYLDIHPRRLKEDLSPRSILTRAEIQSIYEATFAHTRQDSIALGQRDRAIIAIFYGCGLRKNEGTSLNIDDIQVDKGVLLVRKGKGNKERFVPVAGKHLEDLQRYMEEGRHWFLEDHGECAFYYRDGKPRPRKKNTNDEAFFLSIHGRRMQRFYPRLNILLERAGIEKQIGLHSLRHSIATHLLQGGMEIEEIRRFLGHSTLESTQIYTHIVNEIKREQENEQRENLHLSIEPETV